jgi:hypothetical protein
VMNADGSGGMHRVSPSANNQYAPAWQPLGGGDEQ